MNVNIYYGGRGMIDDPTLYVISRMQQVLEELRVNVMVYRLYELKNSITSLPRTLKEADGIILASTVEWHGIGGYMHQFLDACWLYGDKERINSIYMCPVVMSTTYGEREGKLDLSLAWEILGGLPASGLCGYISDTAQLERNREFTEIIEKKAETLYRTLSQRTKSLPASNQAIRQMISVPQDLSLTPQETEQLSVYASDDRYVQRQKADIIELAELFRDKMGQSEPRQSEEALYINEFLTHFHPVAGLAATYAIHIGDSANPLVIKVEGPAIDCTYSPAQAADVELSMEADTLDSILSGDSTFQKTFMSGGMKKKGDFKLMRALDQLFVFS